MIARTWSGATTTEDADEYLEYLQRTGVAECEATSGNRGVYVLRRSDEERAVFLFISLWDSMESIVGFSGPEPEKAVFFPQDDRYLVDREYTVEHFEVLIATPGTSS